LGGGKKKKKNKRLNFKERASEAGLKGERCRKEKSRSKDSNRSFQRQSRYGAGEKSTDDGGSNREMVEKTRGVGKGNGRVSIW